MKAQHIPVPATLLAAALLLLTAPVCLPQNAVPSSAQMPIGTVAAADASVAPPAQIVAGKALLPAVSTVTAHDHTAEVDLEHHGLVLVCATTALHVIDVGAESKKPDGPLMLSMDRGALELRIAAHNGDVLLTPDLRIEPTSAASLSLAIRVARNGDTCMENRAIPGALTLDIQEQFGDGEYLLHPGQHVLFNYGSVRQVVDNEPSPCGCPSSPAGLIADAGQTPAAGNAQKYPFPLAQSEGLAPTPPAKPAPAGVSQVTINANMSFNGNNPPPPEPAQAASAPASAAPQNKAGFFARVGHFFRHIFGGK